MASSAATVLSSFWVSRSAGMHLRQQSADLAVSGDLRGDSASTRISAQVIPRLPRLRQLDCADLPEVDRRGLRVRQSIQSRTAPPATAASQRRLAQGCQRSPSREIAVMVVASSGRARRRWVRAMVSVATTFQRYLRPPPPLRITRSMKPGSRIYGSALPAGYPEYADPLDAPRRKMATGGRGITREGVNVALRAAARVGQRGSATGKWSLRRGYKFSSIRCCPQVCRIGHQQHRGARRDATTRHLNADALIARTCWRGADYAMVTDAARYSQRSPTAVGPAMARRQGAAARSSCAVYARAGTSCSRALLGQQAEGRDHSSWVNWERCRAPARWSQGEALRRASPRFKLERRDNISRRGVMKVPEPWFSPGPAEVLRGRRSNAKCSGFPLGFAFGGQRFIRSTIGMDRALGCAPAAIEVEFAPLVRDAGQNGL